MKKIFYFTLCEICVQFNSDAQNICEASLMLCGVFFRGKNPLHEMPAFERRGISRETVQFFLDYRRELKNQSVNQ